MILTELLMTPFELALQVLEAIKKEVDREMLNTVESIREKMMAVQLMYELNKVSKREYEEAMRLLEDGLRRLEGKAV